ncbi:rho guanyl nucleotide exchange factor [Aspergillus bombycis]|uniref:Rho guanyl nucleotide exchange factor n=1 Tax=Aspergillus bombycis TaxID=109264 RepID=A0A1F8AF91_9EURO|nr:rho guanyl nucleotide exchange factor [Aspergillus bombycis]OGM50069.1 rho guanyl nucleotide exchange factor [Aspergillus bombycis]
MQRLKEEVAEKRHLVMGDLELEAKHRNSTDSHASEEHTPSFLSFRRWVNSFRAKKSYRPCQRLRYVKGWSDTTQTCCDNTNALPCGGGQDLQWECLSGHSSNLETIKTSTLSVASQSVARSRGTTQSTNRSVGSELRGSIESLRPALSFTIDEEAQNRAVKRRKVLREIITTESDYVFGLKALINVLFLFSTRPEIYHNLHQIRELHEDLLARIRKVTPMSILAAEEYDRLVPHGVHERFNPTDLSLRALRNRSIRICHFKKSVLSRFKELAAEANEALEVAVEIGKLSKSFSTYMDFCRNYEQLTEDVDILRRSVPNWSVLENGIEALSKSVASIENQALEHNKSMLLHDLLIKPIQRLCKYPLLLQELLKWTYIQDDPTAHDGIHEALEGVRTMINQINKAPGNPVNKGMVQRTLLLQEMLGLPRLKLAYERNLIGFQVALHHIYKQLGPMTLCGVLHTTYQTSTCLAGDYMVCVLFKSHFLLAKINNDGRSLGVVACLYVCDAKIDTLRNGKGLCCHGCFFSWKLAFQYQNNKYELVLSASSAYEEKQWKTEFLKSAAISADMQRPVSSELRGYSFLTLDLAPLDQVLSSEPSFSRTASVHSVAISRVESDLQHVVIKRTHCPNKQGQITRHIDGEFERPKLSLPESPIILTTRRQDRIRLERIISSVYTRECLPYPGMSLAKGDILFRPSTIMRHFTVRPGVYRRSSSVNLPRSQSVVEKPYSTSEATQRKWSNDSDKDEALHAKWGFDDEKHVGSPPKSSMGTIRRSKTLRLRNHPRSSCGLNHQKTDKGDGSCERAESPLKTSIRIMFNSMSLRRPKRSPGLRVSVSGG